MANNNKGTGIRSQQGVGDNEGMAEEMEKGS